MSIIAQMVIFVLMARQYGAEFLGKYSYFLTFINVCATFADFGTTVTFAKDIPRFRGKELELYWGNVILIRIALSCIVMIIATVMVPFLHSGIMTELIIGIVTIPFAASRIFDPIFQIFGKPWFISFSNGIYGIGLVIMSLPWFIWKGSVLMFCFSYLIAQILYLLIAWNLSGRLIRPVFSLNRKLCLLHLRIAFPIGVSFIFTAINSRADMFLLAWIRGDREVGLYSAVYKVVDMAALAAVLATNPLIPILSQKMQEGPQHFKNVLLLICLFLMGVLIPLALSVPLFSERLVTLIYGENFREVAPALNVFSWVCVLIFLSLLSSSVCLVMDKVNFEWWNAAIAASLNITLNLYLIPSYGYLGAAWSTLVSEIWIVGVTLFFMLRTFVSRYGSKTNRAEF